MACNDAGIIYAGENSHVVVTVLSTWIMALVGVTRLQSGHGQLNSIPQSGRLAWLLIRRSAEGYHGTPVSHWPDKTAAYNAAVC